MPPRSKSASIFSMTRCIIFLSKYLEVILERELNLAHACTRGRDCTKRRLRQNVRAPPACRRATQLHVIGSVEHFHAYRSLRHERYLPLASPDGNVDRPEGRRLRGEPLQIPECVCRFA